MNDASRPQSRAVKQPQITRKFVRSAQCSVLQDVSDASVIRRRCSESDEKHVVAVISVKVHVLRTSAHVAKLDVFHRQRYRSETAMIRVMIKQVMQYEPRTRSVESPAQARRVRTRSRIAPRQQPY